MAKSPEKKHIALIGMMGSGKTSIGRLLSEKLHCPFLDTDEMVSEKAQKSISEIFEESGESDFRVLEEKAMAESLSGLLQTVVATGGGVVISESNRELLKSKSKVIWLKANPTNLLQRLSGQEDRPLLKSGNAEKKLQEIMVEREPLYRKISNLKIDTENKTQEEAVFEILTWLQSQ